MCERFIYNISKLNRAQQTAITRYFSREKRIYVNISLVKIKLKIGLLVDITGDISC